MDRAQEIRMSRDLSDFIDEWGFFTPLPELVIEHMAELGVDAFCLFAYLRYRTHRDRKVAYPKYETIARDTGMRHERIAAAIRALEIAGMLVRTKRFGGSTIYRLVPPPVLGGAAQLATSSPAGGGMAVQTAAASLRCPEKCPPTGGEQSSDRRRPVLRQAEGIQDSFIQDTSLPDRKNQDNGGSKAASALPRWFACPKCGAPIDESHRGTEIESDCRLHRGMARQGK
jgi:hypothetical protein